MWLNLIRHDFCRSFLNNEGGEDQLTLSASVDDLADKGTETGEENEGMPKLKCEPFSERLLH